MSANTIRTAWGCIYSVDENLPKIYLTDYKGTFWVNKNGNLLKKNSSTVMDTLITKKLFKIKQFQDRENMIMTIEPRGKQNNIEVNGTKLNNVKPIEGGRCEIYVDALNLNLVFEAFCDLAMNEALRDIGKQYRIINLIGRGGFGTVYKGLMVKEETFCAIKIIREEKFDAQLEQEHQLLAQLEHDNIIQFIDMVHTRSRQFLITEYGDGGSLRHRIYNGADIDEGLAKKMFKPLFTGIAYMHERGILHRDLKPANIVFMSADENCCDCKIIDFGLSCLESDELVMRRICGSFKYIAPETLHRKLFRIVGLNDAYPKKVDVWGIGLCLYMSLTKQRPFTFHKDLMRYRRVLQEGKSSYVKKKCFSTLSTPTQNLLHMCLDVDSNARASSTDLTSYKWQ